jgi:hypothetical protein
VSIIAASNRGMDKLAGALHALKPDRLAGLFVNGESDVSFLAMAFQDGTPEGWKKAWHDESGRTESLGGGIVAAILSGPADSGLRTLEIERHLGVPYLPKIARAILDAVLNTDERLRGDVHGRRALRMPSTIMTQSLGVYGLCAGQGRFIDLPDAQVSKMKAAEWHSPTIWFAGDTAFIAQRQTTKIFATKTDRLADHVQNGERPGWRKVHDILETPLLMVSEPWRNDSFLVVSTGKAGDRAFCAQGFRLDPKGDGTRFLPIGKKVQATIDGDLVSIGPSGAVVMRQNDIVRLPPDAYPRELADLHNRISATDAET